MYKKINYREIYIFIKFNYICINYIYIMDLYIYILLGNPTVFNVIKHYLACISILIIL